MKARTRLLTVGSLSLLGTVGAMAQTSIEPAPAFTPEALQAQPSDGWVTNGDNISNQRYSPLTGINRDNVGGIGIRLESSDLSQSAGGRPWP